jgi:hypothetical protein
MIGTAAWAKSASANLPLLMPSVVEQFTADSRSLDRTYPLDISQARMARLERFDSDELALLAAMNFDSLAESDKIDYLLLKNRVTSDLHRLAIQKKHVEEMKTLLPFYETIESLMEDKRLMKRPDGEKAASALTAMVKRITEEQKTLDPKAHEKDAPEGFSKTKVDPVVANRARIATDELKEALKNWFEQYHGYDPDFTWWVDQPYKDADKALTGYSTFLKEKVADALIPYMPEELIAIAQTEYDWCMREMLKASHEMGFGDDWHAALEKVKQMHGPPGEQPELIRKLVVEGSDFVKKNQLVTVPPLADETWRMIMMTPERQLVNPFFTGGSEISVSYPTDTMTYEQREMSMRGNNIPFARATAFHEMIPGHFLQFYMGARYRPYRRAFETPFWHEGNALWWEMLFWDKGFDRTPEERVGALVWRMHRSARIIFTMNFHLGRWTPQQCVQSLIDNVGFEPDNAAAEVRRSFDGSVGSLYQSAYLLGALQFRALHHELVDSKKMTDLEFHDVILHENSMPVELLRADLEHLPLARDFTTSWKFYGDHPTHP